jgi:hypothetical protein
MLIGHTATGSIAVMVDEGRKYTLYQQSGGWHLRAYADFSNRIVEERVPVTEVEWLAWHKVNEAEQELRNICIRFKEDQAFAVELLRMRDRTMQTVEVLDAVVRKRIKDATMGDVRKSMTARQWDVIVRHGKYPTGFDRVVYATLTKRLQALRYAAQKRRPGRGWVAPTPRPSSLYLATLRSQLNQKREIARAKRDAAARKRLEPLNKFLLHVAHRFDKSVYALHNQSQIRVGMGVTGHSQFNRGRWRSTPGAAGVQLIRGRVVLTTVQRGGKCFAFKMPANWRKAAVGVAHPRGLFCVASKEYPGFYENWGFDVPDKITAVPISKRPLKDMPHHARMLPSCWRILGYSYKGVRVPENVMRREYAPEDILEEDNQEVRRIMIELLAPEILEASGILKVLHRDDFGTLFVAGLPADAYDLSQPRLGEIEYRRTCDTVRRFGATKHSLTLFVKVVNSTAEPDGTFKDYYLQVPPHISSSKEAVAWTFGLRADHYNPTFES